MKNREEKQQLIKDLAEKLAKAKTTVFADLSGIGVNQTAQLRQQIKEKEAELNVTKNTLLSRALAISHKRLAIRQFAGPTATLFAYGDEIAPLKAIANFFGNLGVGKLKGAIFENRFLSEAEIENLAHLPTKEALRGQLVSTISAPLYNLATVLRANLMNLVSVLRQAASKS